MLLSGIGFPELGVPLIMTGGVTNRAGIALEASADLYDGNFSSGFLKLTQLSLDYVGDKTIKSIDNLEGYKPTVNPNGTLRVNPSGEKAKSLLRLYKDGINVGFRESIKKINNEGIYDDGASLDCEEEN